MSDDWGDEFATEFSSSANLFATSTENECGTEQNGKSPIHDSGIKSKEKDNKVHVLSSQFTSTNYLSN